MSVKGRTALAFTRAIFRSLAKKTPGVGYFWSGCAGKTKWGLEFCGMAVLGGSFRETAFHLLDFKPFT